MSGTNEERLVQVFAGTPWQAELVIGLLEANGITCVIKDETVGAVTSSYAGLDGDVLVIVAEEHEERALEVIRNNVVPVAPEA